MTIITERSSENGVISVNHELCNLCGFCVDICKDFSLEITDGKVVMSNNPLFGCMACAACVVACPQHALTLTGRETSPADFKPIPDINSAAGYDSLKTLLDRRRSVRDYKDKPVEQEVIDKIVAAASTAPMGVPPSDVYVSVIAGKQKVREFSFECIDVLKKSAFLFSPFTLALMRPFMSKLNYVMSRTFISPLISTMAELKKEGKNLLLYDAPLAMVFSSYATDPADPQIAATYAMLAAEALGLGSCMIGSIMPFLKYGNTPLKIKYGIHPKAKYGLVVIFGYPKYKIHQSINRTFASLKFIS